MFSTFSTYFLPYSNFEIFLRENLFSAINVPSLAHGKMYKRYTFEHLALHSELVSGIFGDK